MKDTCLGPLVASTASYPRAWPLVPVLGTRHRRYGTVYHSIFWCGTVFNMLHIYLLSRH